MKLFVKEHMKMKFDKQSLCTTDRRSIKGIKLKQVGNNLNVCGTVPCYLIYYIYQLRPLYLAISSSPLWNSLSNKIFCPLHAAGPGCHNRAIRNCARVAEPPLNQTYRKKSQIQSCSTTQRKVSLNKFKFDRKGCVKYQIPYFILNCQLI